MLSAMKKKRHGSTASVATNKGLLNEPGENNCFLNSAIQVLWHLDVFRRSFRRLSGHACMGASCIFCALKEIFEQFQYSKDRALPPNVLRSALAESFQQENRFQLGLMDDAAECFENILNRIHVHIGNTMHEDVCTAPHCIPHQKFGLTLVQHSVCPCGATSEPFPFIEMVHYVSSTALCAENEAVSQRYGPSGVSQMFGRLIRVAGSWGDVRSCPSDCGQKVEMRKVLMNCPDVVSIGIVWDSEEPDVRQIIDLVNALGTTLRLTDLFHTVVDERASQLEMYLVGMVCYYGKHYSTFFFHTKLRKWVYFDDAQVSEVGKRWSNVITKCIKGHHQPLLLLYANPNADPVTIATAPKEVTLLPGYSNHVIPNEPLYDIPETDSVLSEDDDLSIASEENSETESIHVSRPHRHSAEMKHYEQSNLLKSSPTVHKSHANEKDRHGYHAASKSKSSKGHKQNASYDLHQLNDLAIISNEHHEKKRQEQAKPRKSTFQWHMADDQSRNGQKKMGNYVEPQPANWTQYKPYESHSKSQQATSSDSQRKHAKVSPDRNAVSVKAIDSKGMAAFCVTGKNSDLNSSHDNLHGPSPSARAKQGDVVSIGKRSPGSSRRSSHSSHSSHSSMGPSSRKSGSSANSGAKSGHSSGSHAPLIDFDEDSLHASAQQFHTNLIPILNSTVTPPSQAISNRPSLPPKPPFLSRPLAGSTTPQLYINSNSHSQVHTYENVANVNISSRLNVEKCSDAASRATDRCIALLRDADDLLEESRRAADTDRDYSSALQLCLEATKTVETVLLTKNLPDEYLVKARMRHGDCINKSQILQRRRNVSMKSQGNNGSRSSTPQSKRHATSSSNQLLKPTRISSSSSSNSSSPSSSRKNLAACQLSPSRNEFESFEQDDSQDNLIDFDKQGITNFQHTVENLYKRQTELKGNISHHLRPNNAAHKKSNTNNSNNTSSTCTKPVKAMEKTKKERTNIFVFGSPDKAKSQSVKPPAALQATEPDAENSKSEQKNSQKLNFQSSVMSSSRANVIDVPDRKQLKQNAGSSAAVPASYSPPKFRSVTPTPPSPVKPSVSQQRRSKTPTPAMNKELLRARQAMQRRGSDLNPHSKSAIVPPRTVATSGTSVTTTVAATTSPVKPVTIGYPYPYPFPTWNNPSLLSPSFSSATVPNYDQFFRWLQYYASLSSEQQKSLSAYNPNPTSPAYPNAPTSSHYTAPPAMQAALVEHLRTQLGKNFSNVTNSMGRATPSRKAANSNIYEASKPKPVTKAKSSTHIPTDDKTSQNFSHQSNADGAASKRGGGLSRRPYLDVKPNNLHSRGEESLSKEAPLKMSREDLRPLAASRESLRPSSGDSFDELHSSSQSTHSQNNHSSLHHGRIKRADESKRISENSVALQNRSVQEVAHRNRREPDKSLSSAFPVPPKSTIFPSTNIHSSGIMAGKRDTKCALCGLVDVPSPGDYCVKCREYLKGPKPVAVGLRVAKKT